jgi:uncharacterized protein (TIGR04255 family)
VDDDSVAQAADQTQVRLLNVPRVEPAHYNRNFIRNAVCELRFPTIFEIEDQRPPSNFWRTLRKDFPIHSVLSGVQVGPASMAKSNAHQFKSKRSRWTVVLKPSSITLETAQYDTFEEFEAQLRTVIAAAKQTIDSDFFTRIGLRYVNTLPCGPRDVAGWVNPALVGPLSEGVFGDVEIHFQQIRGTTDCGGYFFQHGLGVDAGPSVGKGYVLDFDFYREEVGVDDALTTIQRLHELEFSMFSWALGDRAREHLTAKKGATK